jgi:hypothetical protein
LKNGLRVVLNNSHNSPHKNKTLNCLGLSVSTVLLGGKETTKKENSMSQFHYNKSPAFRVRKVSAVEAAALKICSRKCEEIEELTKLAMLLGNIRLRVESRQIDERTFLLEIAGRPEGTQFYLIEGNAIAVRDLFDPSVFPDISAFAHAGN